MIRAHLDRKLLAIGGTRYGIQLDYAIDRLMQQIAKDPRDPCPAYSAAAAAVDPLIALICLITSGRAGWLACRFCLRDVLPRGEGGAEI